MSLVVTSYNGVSFCSKDCFYAFYKLGNAPKSVSARASPRTPWGSLQRSLRPLAGGEGGCSVLPKNPTPPRPFGLRPYRLCCVVPQHPLKINPSYGLDVINFFVNFVNPYTLEVGTGEFGAKLSKYKCALYG